MRNPSQMMTKEELLEYTKNYYEQYLYVYDIYNAFLDSSIAEKHGSKANAYFKMLTSACIDSYIMTLARLYDELGDPETINKLINTCKDHKDLFSHPDEMFGFITEKGRELKKDKMLRNAIEVIRHRRNKYIAHNDEAYFAHNYDSDSAVADKKKLPSYQVWMLIKYTRDLLEKILDELEYDKSNMIKKYNREFFALFPELEDYRFDPIG